MGSETEFESNAAFEAIRLAHFEDALREKANQTCIFMPGDIPCPDEWPDKPEEWCASCFARTLLREVAP